MSEHPSDSLPRQLGVGALWLLIINGMIGAGIFGIPAEAARLVGDFSPLLFLLTALLMAPVLLCFAELSSATRETGGPARYVGIAFGPMAGFQAGWALYIARLTALAANFNLLQSALAHFWPVLGEGAPRVLGLGLLGAVPRVSYSLAVDGLLPSAFAQISPRFQTPVFSIVVYALLGWALAASGSFVWLAALSVLTRLLIYLACIAAMPAVRRQAEADAWRLRGGYLVPALAALFCLALLSRVSWQSVLATGMLLAVGSGLYGLARRGLRD